MITIKEQNIYNTKHNRYFIDYGYVHINSIVYVKDFDNIDKIIKQMKELGFKCYKQTIRVNCLLCFKSRNKINDININDVKQTINIQ